MPLFLLLLSSGCAFAPSPSQPLALHASPGSSVVGQVAGSTALPAPGARVYAYRSSRSGLRGPADFEAVADARGGYILDLAAGSYYLVARERELGGDSGPMRSGDRWAVHVGNPVRLQEGELLRIDFRLQPVVRSQQLRDASITPAETGFAGILLDAEGRAVAGSFVLAFRQGEGRRQPGYSTVAGTDGRFILYAPAPGPYCLVARSELRGQPRRGELSGHLGTDEQGCITLNAGELREVGAIVLVPYHP